MLKRQLGEVFGSRASTLVHQARFMLAAARTAAVLSSWLGAASAFPPALADREVSFQTEIAPLLQRACVVCHGPEKAKGHFRLDTYASLLNPGSSDMPTVVPGQPEASHLYQLIVERNAEDRMPQNADSLPPEEIAMIRSWIASGAKFDGPSVSAPLVTLQPKPKPSLAPERYSQPWPVTALAFSPDGTQLAVGGYHEITFWNPATGALQRRLGGMPERTLSLAWQPGGDLLAIAGGAPGCSGTILLVDLSRNLAPVELVVVGDEMLCANFSPDGARLGVGGTDNSLRVFDVNSRLELLKLEQHSDWVHAVAFSPDGRWLTSASRDRTARVYNSTNGEAVSVFRGHEAAVEFVVLNGELILSAGVDRRVRSWDSADGGHAKEFAQFDTTITGLASAGDSVFIALADGRVSQRHLPDGAEECEFSGSSDRVTAVALYPEWQWLVTGSHDGQVRLWNWQDGERLAEFMASPGFRPGDPK